MNISSQIRPINFGNVDLTYDMEKYITLKYNEDHRTYHGVDHINQMMDLNILDNDDHKISLMILFHDIVYDPSSTENEYWSAMVARQYMADRGYTSSYVDFIVKGIMATKNHWESRSINDPVIDRFLDYDLWDFGTPYYEVFEYNTNNLCDEYAMSKSENLVKVADWDAYCKEFDEGRKKWLMNVSKYEKHFSVYTERNDNANRNIARALTEFE